MNGQINHINTEIEHWKETCLDWAEARVPFEIHRIGDTQLEFLINLCDKFNYELNYDSNIKNPSIALLIPRD